MSAAVKLLELGDRGRAATPPRSTPERPVPRNDNDRAAAFERARARGMQALERLKFWQCPACRGCAATTSDGERPKLLECTWCGAVHDRDGKGGWARSARTVKHVGAPPRFGEPLHASVWGVVERSPW